MKNRQFQYLENRACHDDETWYIYKVQCFSLKTQHMRKEGNRKNYPNIQSGVKSKGKPSILKQKHHCVAYYSAIYWRRYFVITWKCSVTKRFCVIGGSQSPCLLLKVNFRITVTARCRVQSICS